MQPYHQIDTCLSKISGPHPAVNWLEIFKMQSWFIDWKWLGTRSVPCPPFGEPDLVSLIHKYNISLFSTPYGSIFFTIVQQQLILIQPIICLLPSNDAIQPLKFFNHSKTPLVMLAVNATFVLLSLLHWKVTLTYNWTVENILTTILLTATILCPICLPPKVIDQSPCQNFALDIFYKKFISWPRNQDMEMETKSSHL